MVDMLGRYGNFIWLGPSWKMSAVGASGELAQSDLRCSAVRKTTSVEPAGSDMAWAGYTTTRGSKRWLESNVIVTSLSLVWPPGELAAWNFRGRKGLGLGRTTTTRGSERLLGSNVVFTSLAIDWSIRHKRDRRFRKSSVQSLGTPRPLAAMALHVFTPFTGVRGTPHVVQSAAQSRWPTFSLPVGSLR